MEQLQAQGNMLVKPLSMLREIDFQQILEYMEIEKFEFFGTSRKDDSPVFLPHSSICGTIYTILFPEHNWN